MVSLLSAVEGSEVKEYGDREEAIGFLQKAVIEDFERAAEVQLERDQWGENEGSK